MRKVSTRTIQSILLGSCIFVMQGCGSSGDEQQTTRETPAVLAPLITFPADGATVSGVTEVRVDLDPSASYKSVVLLVDGVEVASDGEAPFSLEWNPYFQSSAEEASIVVKATTATNQLLRSDISLVNINHNAYAPAIALTDPQTLQGYAYGTDSVSVQWSPVPGATEYEYRTNDNLAIKIESPDANIPLDEGVNSLRVRAAQDDQWGDWVYVGDIFVSEPTSPAITINSAVEEYVIDFDVALDPNANFTQVTLIVNDQPIKTLSDAPFSFSWDPYFVVGGLTGAYWFVEVTLADGRKLQSPVEFIDYSSPAIRDRVNVTLANNGSDYYGIDELAVSWNPVDGAVSYDYEYAGSITSTDLTAVNLQSLMLGTYNVRARAVDADGNVGVWSQAKRFTIALPKAPVFSTELTEYSNVQNVAVSWPEIAGASSYQYRLTDQWVDAGDLSVEVATAEPGFYTLGVRGVDALGREGAIGTFNFRVSAPFAPNLVLTENVNETELLLNVNWGEQSQDVIVEVAKDYAFDNVIYNYTSNNNTHTDFSLPAGGYYVRAKTSNEVGHQSEWYRSSKFNLGLFYIEEDIATFGFDSADRPVDFIIDTSAITLLSANGNSGDGSGDDFNIAKVARGGNAATTESFGSIARSPRSLAKAASGAIATGSSINYQNSTIIGTNDIGSYLWHKTIKSEMPDDNTRLEDRVQNAATLSDGRVVYASTYNIWDIDGNSSRLSSQEQRVTILDENRENPIVATIPAPEEGELQYLSQLLIDNDEIYAAGRYTFDNTGDASDDVFTPVTTKNGAFLAIITPQGDVTSIVTGGGLSNSSINSMSKMNDNIVVSYSNYDRCAATLFRDAGEPEAIYLGGVNYCYAVLSSNQDVILVGKDNDSAVSGEPLVVSRFRNGGEQERIYISRLSNNFQLKKVKYDPVFGVVVAGTYKFGSSYDDTRTVIFNISDDFEHIAN